MKKKILNLATVGLTSALLLSNGISYATPSTQKQSSEISSYAYLDYNSASNDMKKKIIEAREKIVYSQSWTVDGKVSKMNIDGSIEKVPEFKDLFPNWSIIDLTDLPDLPEENETSGETNPKDNKTSDSKSSELKGYAYMDYDSASDSMKKLILEERRSIVYGEQSWTVDGKVSKINEDGTTEKLPEFKELYPDWDLEELTKVNEIDRKTVTDNVVSMRSGDFSGNVHISNTSNSFYSFNAGLEKQTIVWASTLPTGSKINLGFTNDNTGRNEGWLANLDVNQGITLNQTPGVRYTVRASTYDNPGWSYINVKPI